MTPGQPIAEMFAAIYPELRQVAARLMLGERRDHTLQRTALTNEAISQLLNSDLSQITSDRHLLAVTVRKMRRILVDHARRGGAIKRGGEWEKLPELSLVGISDGQQDRLDDWVSLNLALEKLGGQDERALQVVELKFVGGFTNAETASILNISDATVEAVWFHARLWLAREMAGRS